MKTTIPGAAAMLVATFPLTTLAADNTAGAPASATVLPTVIVESTELEASPLGAEDLEHSELEAPSYTAGDSAKLLRDIPGMSLHGAGGISSLPVLRGLADERLRIQVDGMDPASACPNHMNSALSYINPTRIDKVTVLAGITPVSAGGDSIGGTIQVESLPPEFTEASEGVVAEGEAGVYYHSNGEGWGYNLGARLAGPVLYLSYDQSETQSDNYKAGKDFKPAGPGGIVEGDWLEGDEVGSTGYEASINKELGLALRHDNHLLQLNLGLQKVGFEGFPNQRMDMTYNLNRLTNLRYTGQYGWGELKAHLSHQGTRHEMDMGQNRFSYGTGMPMRSDAHIWNASVTGEIEVTEADLFRLGTEVQTYDLDDWWPPVGGMMGPDTFWNIYRGTRNRFGLFAEWERHWNPQWTSLFGIRNETVVTDAGDIQGYATQPTDLFYGIWATDAALFNAQPHRRTDQNWDLVALMRFVPNERHTFEIGYARKTRSPSLYERYVWSTQPMVALMNNFVGDGNSYVGDINLKPETANTLSVTGDWHDAEKERWGLKASGYFTYVVNYIDARRCDSVQCGGAANVAATESFVNLQYVNQSARIYGFDLSGHLFLGKVGNYGSFTARGMASYVNGKNRVTNDNLYHIMPLNAQLTLEQKLGVWTNSAELELVAAKERVSRVRNEIPTSGYGLFNLRSRYEWKRLRLDFSVENLFNRFYSQPLGGAYLGQGASMAINSIPWGVAVPGPGRSINIALNVYFD